MDNKAEFEGFYGDLLREQSEEEQREAAEEEAAKELAALTGEEYVPPAARKDAIKLVPHTENIIKNVSIVNEQTKHVFDQLKTIYQEVQAKEAFLTRLLGPEADLATAETVEAARTL